MKIDINYVGKIYNKPASIIELTFSNETTSFTIEATKLDRSVDENLIDNLRGVADELEKQNNLLLEQKENE